MPTGVSNPYRSSTVANGHRSERGKGFDTVATYNTTFAEFETTERRQQRTRVQPKPLRSSGGCEMWSIMFTERGAASPSIFQRIKLKIYRGEFFLQHMQRLCCMYRTSVGWGALPDFFNFFFPVEQTTSGIGHVK